MMRARVSAVLVAGMVLSACGDSDVKEVKQWMAEVKQQTKVAVPPLVEPKNFIPFAYGGKDALDPFSPNKLLVELAKTQSKANGPDTGRRKEALESFPLDSIRMVGAMEKGGVMFALLQIDKAVYRVQSGQHIGQNFGLITGVTEAVVDIREIVQDAGGEWVERKATLELQESKETKK